MGNKHTFIGVLHTFIDVSAYSTRPITHDPDENFDKGVLIPHNAQDPSKTFDAEKHLASVDVVRS